MTFKSGRGGKRKGAGAPRKPPGVKKIVKGPYKLAPDVVAKLDAAPNATRLIELAVRKYRPEGEQVEARAVRCSCGRDYCVVGGVGSCPAGCKRSDAFYETRGQMIKL